MTIRDIAIAFSYEVDKNSEKKANDSIEKLKSVASKALGAIAIVFSIKGLASLAEAAANAEALESQFSQVFGNMEDQAAKSLNNIAKETGVVTGRMKGSFTQIAAFAKTSGMQTEDALSMTDRAMRAVADSAAFYDKSLEQVTDSLQSFLKGNFANDAALGLSATETTRNAAANALYGKSFKDLAEDQKQLTLLQMVEDANKLSGAMGQAARESDTWGNQLGNLKQNLKDLQATVGSAFLKPAVQVLKLLSLLVSYVTKAIKDLTAEGRLLNRMFERFNNWLKKVQVYVERFVSKVGGAENAFKLLAIAAASLFIAMNAGAILKFLKSFASGLNLASLKVFAIAAVILLIALAVEDFINFMQGNDSVIGALFEKWGIDADGVRKSIIETWEKIKVFLATTWKAIKDIFKGVIQFISGVFTGDWKKAFGGLKEIVGTVFTYIEQAFGRFAPVVKAVGIAFAAWKVGTTFASLAKGTVSVVKNTVALVANTVGTVANTVAKTASTAAQTAWNAAAKAGTAISKGLGAAFKFMTSPLGIAIVIIGALIAAFVLFQKSGGDIDAFIQKFADGLDNVIGVVENVIAGIAEKAPQIIQAITGAITKVVSVIAEKLPMFLDMGIELITSLIDGLVKMLPEIIEAIIGLVTALITAIADFLPKLIDAGIKILLALISGLVSVIPKLITAVVALIPVIIKAIVGALPKLIKAGIQIILSLVQGIVKALPQIIKAVVELIPTVIGALLKAIPQLLKAGVEIIVAIVTGLVQAIPELLKAIPQIIGAVLDGFAELFPGLAPLFDGVKKHFEIVFNAIAKIFEKVVGIFKTVFGIFKSLFTGDWQGLWDGIKKYFSQVWDLIKTIFQAVFDVFKNILSVFAGVFEGIFTAVGDFFKGIWEGIKSFFQGVWDFLVGIVKTYVAVWQAIFQAVGDFFQAIWNAIVAFFQGVWNTITGAVTAAGELLKAIFTAVGEFFKGIWDGIVGFFKGIWDTIVGAVTGAGDTIKGIFTAVGDFFKGIWEGVSGFFGGIWDGIVGVVKGAMDKVMGFIQPILDTVGKVKDAVGGVIDGAKNVVGGAVDKVKGFLGFANGTESTPDTFVAGERGPELITGAAGRKVFTADKTSGIVGAVGEAVKMAASVVGAAKSALSEPKEVDVNVTAPQSNGGVAEAVKGIGGMINGAFKLLSDKLPQAKEAADKGGLTEAIKAFGSDISMLARSAVASPATVQSMVSSTTNKSVMQNNYFENTFNGERAAQQRSKSVAEKNSNDATGQLARALAYAR